MKAKIFALATIVLSTVFYCTWPSQSAEAADIRDIIFPVIGDTRFSNDFGAPRSGGRTHEANDILGYKLQPLVAAVDGTVRFVPYPEPEYGYVVYIQDEDGYQYRYYHINNDTSGTDDGLGGGRDAYAPDMERPLPVVAGQLLGWMGDSGNAEYTTPHLHFEIRRPDGAAINPYESLTRATHISQPVNHPALPGELLPYGVFQGGSNIATGEFDGDPATRELVTGAGPGGGPHVRIFSEEGELLNQFMAFHPDFRGGVDVAAGDADNDGLDEVIVVPWQNANPIVRVFSTDGLLQREFFAYGEDFQGGVRVGAADLNNDGVTEIVTGTGIGGGPHVRVFSPKGFVVSQFFAYPEQFRGGVDVAAASSTKTSPAMIITGAGPGGGPHVRVFNRFGTVLSQWFPYHESFRGGVRVYAGNAVGKSSSAPEIITSPASRGGPDFRLYSHTGELLENLDAFERWWTGAYDVAIAERNMVYVASGAEGRRATIRWLD